MFACAELMQLRVTLRQQRNVESIQLVLGHDSPLDAESVQPSSVVVGVTAREHQPSSSGAVQQLEPVASCC